METVFTKEELLRVIVNRLFLQKPKNAEIKFIDANGIELNAIEKIVIGVRGATEAFRSYLHAIINYRTTNGLPTVYTSNLPIEDMAQVFDDRLYDRMRDQCAVLHFEGGSKRGIRKK